MVLLPLSVSLIACLALLTIVCAHAWQVLAPADQEAKLGPLARQHGAAMHVLEPLQGVALPHRQSCINAAGTGALDVFSTLASAHHQQAGVEQITHDGAWLEFQSALKGPLGGDAGGQGALIIYTSGTTGKPKGVLHTHR